MILTKNKILDKKKLSDISTADFKKIILQSVKEANKEQRKLVKKFNKLKKIN